jgi:hypothetical protein
VQDAQRGALTKSCSKSKRCRAIPHLAASLDGISRGDWRDALGEEASQWMANIEPTELLMYSRGEVLGQPNLAVDPLQQENPNVL